MSRELSLRPEMPHPVVTHNRAGTQLLLGVRKEECSCCGYGTRIDTLWASAEGEANRISWCQSCFNAECDAVELSERQRRACRALVRKVVLDPPARTWSCARPAIEDLEARGLV